MKYVIAAAVAAFAMGSIAAAETRNLRDFDSVNASDRISVEVSTGEAYRVEITGRDAARVLTEVEHGALKIRQRNRSWFGGPRRIDARVRVVMPAVDGLAAARGASIRAENIETQSMSLAAAMGGSIDISGSCRSVSVSAAMGGAVDADGFHCETARISASMGGAADVFASDGFNASATMGGAVTVSGEPEERDVATSMGGSVSSR